MKTRMLDEILRSGPLKLGKEYYQKCLNFKRTGRSSKSKICELILFLASNYSDGITGKLISAQWDEWKIWANYKKLLQNSDVYTLRRIVGRERGFKWGDK